ISGPDTDSCTSPQTCDSGGSCVTITPGAPTNVSAAVSGPKAILVTWTIPGNNGIPIATYDVLDQAGMVRATVSGATTNMATIGNLTAGAVYAFRVRATNTSGAT